MTRAARDSEAPSVGIALAPPRLLDRQLLVVALGCALFAACSSAPDTGTTSGTGGSMNPGSGGSVVTGSGGSVVTGSGGSVVTGSGGSVITGSGGSVITGSGGSVVTGSGGSVVTGSGGSVVTGTGGAAGAENTGGGGAATGGGGGGLAGGSGSGGAAGSSSGGSAGSAAAGCPTAATFCDDFEASKSLGAAWTFDNTANGMATVVDTFTTMPGPTMAHSGKNAVQISFPAGMGYAMLVSKMGFPAPPAPMGYWARAWLFIETPTTDPGHCVYIEGSTGKNLNMTGARPLNTQKQLMTINIDPVGTGEAGSPNSGPPLAPYRGMWTCFEWQISATGGTGNINTWVNNAVMPTISLSGKPIEALIEQRIGYERYNMGTAGNIWIDDYAIGTTKRIGCQ